MQGDVQEGISLNPRNFRIVGADVDINGSTCGSSSYAVSAGAANNVIAKAELIRSRVTGCGGPSRQPAVVSAGEIKLDNSTVQGPVPTGHFPCKPEYGCTDPGPARVFLSNAKIEGDLRPESGGLIKVVNCSNGTYDPIADGSYQ